MADKMPNRLKFTEPRKQRILAILAAGGSRRTAAAVAGIDPATLRDWLRRGERGVPGGRWQRFLEQVREAEAGPRLVGLPSDDGPDSLKWALGVLDRESALAAAPPDAEESGPVVIELSLAEDRPLPPRLDPEGA
jgi:transposase-like protein